MTSKLEGEGGGKAFVVGSLTKEFFCGFPYGHLVKTETDKYKSGTCCNFGWNLN